MSYCIYLIHITVMLVIDSYASYRVDISRVYIIYYIIFIMAVCIALSYALIMLFEVPLPLSPSLILQAPMVHLEKLLYWSLGVGGLPPVRRVKTE
jgi:hypothetical protein